MISLSSCLHGNTIWYKDHWHWLFITRPWTTWTETWLVQTFFRNHNTWHAERTQKEVDIWFPTSKKKKKSIQCYYLGIKNRISCSANIVHTKSHIIFHQIITNYFSELSLEAQSKCLQGYKNFLQLLLMWFINQVAIAVKLCRRLECVQEELRFVDEMKI